MSELEVAELGRTGLLRRAHGITCNAAAQVLKADLTRHQSLTPLGAAGEDKLAQHLVLDQRQEVVVALVLVMMAVNVDNQNVVELALHGLLAGMREQPAGVELFERDPAAAIGKKVHGAFPFILCRIDLLMAYRPAPRAASPSLNG